MNTFKNLILDILNDGTSYIPYEDRHAKVYVQCPVIIKLLKSPTEYCIYFYEKFRETYDKYFTIEDI